MSGAKFDATGQTTSPIGPIDPTKLPTVVRLIPVRPTRAVGQRSARNVVNNKAYCRDLTCFYPDPAVFQPDTLVRFPFNIDKGDHHEEVLGHRTDGRYRLVHVDPEYPDNWSHSDLAAAAWYTAHDIGSAQWKPPATQYMSLSNEAIPILGRYAFLQGRALNDGLRLFIVPCIVRGLDPEDLEQETNALARAALVNSTGAVIAAGQGNQAFQHNMVAGGANFRLWLDACNTIRMMNSIPFKFAHTFRIWVFIVEVGRSRASGTSWMYAPWNSHVNLLIWDRVTNEFVVFDPNEFGFLGPDSRNAVGAYSMLPRTVGGLASLLKARTIRRARGGQSTQGNCPKHALMFLSDVIEHRRLPDWVECCEVFQLITACTRVVPPDPHHLGVIEIPPMVNDDPPGHRGYNTVEQLREFGDRFQWRKRWQQNLITLNRFRQKHRPAYLEAKKTSDECGAFLNRMALIGAAQHTPQQTADIQTKTQDKAAADAVIAQHQPFIDAIQLLIDDEFDFPEDYVMM